MRIGQCFDIPAFGQCTTPFSVKYAEYGYIASGLAATEISRVEIYSGGACSSSGRSVFELARQIQFKPVDTLIANGLLGGQIAVRQGEFIGDGTVTVIEDGFQPLGCGALPGVPDTDGGTPEACADTISLRIAAVNGLPRLFTDEVSECQPGTTKPAARFADLWFEEDGRIKR